MSFPLYDILAKNLKLEQLTTEEKDKINLSIPKLGIQEHEVIFNLIRVYGLNNTKQEKNIFEIPYGGKSVSEHEGIHDIKFDINKLPNELVQMIYKFVCMCIDK